MVGVSGGPDSVSLLHLLLRLKDDLGFQLCAAHLNHMFRGEEAEADARLVADLAGEWKIPLISKRVNVPEFLKKSGLSTQEGAREVRYRFLREAAAEFGAVRVALGHHADDQAETVLINILRGSGLSGISGIPPVRDGFYIRPLIAVRRCDIELYCRTFGISYREDSSNKKKYYLRNRIRLDLIPLLEENYNPSVVLSLNRMADIVREEDRYLERLAREAFKDSLSRAEKGKLVFSIARLLTYPDVIKRRIIRIACRELAGRGFAPPFGHVEGAIGMLEGAPGGGRFQFPGGIELFKRGSLLEIIKGSAGAGVPFYQYELEVPGITGIPESGKAIAAEIIDAACVGDPKTFPPGEAVLDMESVKGPLRVRRRMDGDVFEPFGGGRTKLKKFLINLKVPREERDAIPIVTCGNDIVWVAGFRPGRQFAVREDTRRCLHLRLLESKAEEI
ncbi:MAG: tRNA lysidine(34) synthetase TilS [Bacillota bacterium]